MKTEDINKKFDHLYRAISSPSFLKMESLGGEIPFFISAYNPTQENEVCKAVRGLVTKLETEGIGILNLNLYDIAMTILEEELGEGEIFELEKQMDKDQFKDALQSTLDINEVFMPHIKQLIDQSNARVYFVTGVGAVFPFIRSHNILNNLQNIAKDAPTVMFFPGEYNGQSLELFGLLRDDNYYRAFNIENFKP